MDTLCPTLWGCAGQWWMRSACRGAAMFATTTTRRGGWVPGGKEVILSTSKSLEGLNPTLTQDLEPICVTKIKETQLANVNNATHPQKGRYQPSAPVPRVAGGSPMCTLVALWWPEKLHGKDTVLPIDCPTAAVYRKMGLKGRHNVLAAPTRQRRKSQTGNSVSWLNQVIQQRLEIA